MKKKEIIVKNENFFNWDEFLILKNQDRLSDPDALVEHLQKTKSPNYSSYSSKWWANLNYEESNLDLSVLLSPKALDSKELQKLPPTDLAQFYEKLSTIYPQESEKCADFVYKIIDQAQRVEGKKKDTKLLRELIIKQTRYHLSSSDLFKKETSSFWTDLNLNDLSQVYIDLFKNIPLAQEQTGDNFRFNSQMLKHQKDTIHQDLKDFYFSESRQLQSTQYYYKESFDSLSLLAYLLYKTNNLEIKEVSKQNVLYLLSNTSLKQTEQVMDYKKDFLNTILTVDSVETHVLNSLQGVGDEYIRNSSINAINNFKEILKLKSPQEAEGSFITCVDKILRHNLYKVEKSDSDNKLAILIGIFHSSSLTLEKITHLVLKKMQELTDEKTKEKESKVITDNNFEFRIVNQNILNIYNLLLELNTTCLSQEDNQELVIKTLTFAKKLEKNKNHFVNINQITSFSDSEDKIMRLYKDFTNAASITQEQREIIDYIEKSFLSKYNYLNLKSQEFKTKHNLSDSDFDRLATNHICALVPYFFSLKPSYTKIMATYPIAFKKIISKQENVKEYLTQDPSVFNSLFAMLVKKNKNLKNSEELLVHYLSSLRSQSAKIDKLSDIKYKVTNILEKFDQEIVNKPSVALEIIKTSPNHLFTLPQSILSTLEQQDVKDVVSSYLLALLEGKHNSYLDRLGNVLMNTLCSGFMISPKVHEIVRVLMIDAGLENKATITKEEFIERFSDKYILLNMPQPNLNKVITRKNNV